MTIQLEYNYLLCVIPYSSINRTETIVSWILVETNATIYKEKCFFDLTKNSLESILVKSVWSQYLNQMV